MSADLAIVRRCLGLEEARVAWSFLRSAGIEASLDMQHLCAMEWRYCFALGLDIRVPIDDAADALAAFAAVDRGDFAFPDVEPLARSVATRLKTLLLFLG